METTVIKQRITFEINQKINGLTYLGEAEPTINNQNKKIRRLKMQCFCGNIFTPRMSDLKAKGVKSCGCMNKEIIRKTHTKHGLTKNRNETKLYSIWKSIKQRCLNPNCKAYINYGGRGITICDEWKNNPELFSDWALSNGYDNGLEIDRINVNGNYEPNNCRFVTRFINSINKRKSKFNTTGYTGISYIKSRKAYSARISINKERLYLGYFKNIEDANNARNEYIIKNNLEHPLN